MCPVSWCATSHPAAGWQRTRAAGRQARARPSGQPQATWGTSKRWCSPSSRRVCRVLRPQAAAGGRAQTQSQQRAAWGVPGPRTARAWRADRPPADAVGSCRQAGAGREVASCQQWAVWEVGELGVVLAFRGTASFEDAVVDVALTPKPLQLPGGGARRAAGGPQLATEGWAGQAQCPVRSAQICGCRCGRRSVGQAPAAAWRLCLRGRLVCCRVLGGCVLRITSCLQGSCDGAVLDVALTPKPLRLRLCLLSRGLLLQDPACLRRGVQVRGWPPASTTATKHDAAAKSRSWCDACGSLPCSDRRTGEAWDLGRADLLACGAGRLHPHISLHSGFYNGVLGCVDDVTSTLRWATSWLLPGQQTCAGS